MTSELTDTGLVDERDRRILTNGTIYLDGSGRMVSCPPLDLEATDEDPVTLNIDLGGDDPKAPVIHTWRRLTPEEKAQRVLDQETAAVEQAAASLAAKQRADDLAVIAEKASTDPAWESVARLIGGSSIK